MRSKIRLLYLGLLSVLAVQGSGCGLLGTKPDLNALLNYNPKAVGCMNAIGAHFQSYYQGTMDNPTWSATWDCATTNLALFKQFVRGSDSRGYTQGDIQDFVGKFLITNQTITPALINALFELKASLFGGTKDIISSDEIDRVNSFLGALKTQTTTLLPFMALRASQPSPANLLALSDALVTAGDGLAASLNTQGNPTFSFASAQVFADQLATILNVTMPADLVAWLSAVKVVLVAGSSSGIASGDWPMVVRAIVSYGGPALAAFSIDPKYLTGPNATGQFALQLAWKIKTSLLSTLSLYGGALPLTELDNVIDSLPASWITIDRSAIKGAMRPITNKLLQSHVPNAIDGSAIDVIFDKLQYWSDSQTALETIFDQLNAGPLGVTASAFTTAAANYALTLPSDERPPVYRVSSLVSQTRPLFLGDDNQMTFTPNDNYSLGDLKLFNIFSIAAQHVVKCYSTVPGGVLGVVGDLKVLVSDFTDLARALHASDLSVPGWATARFLEASLFTYASRGDTTYIDVNEAMYLIAMAYSAGSMSGTLRNGTDAVCPSIGLDILGHNWKSAKCFLNELFTNYRIYWSHQPLLVQFYGNLSSSDKVLLQNAMETAGRRYGISDQPIASSDQDGFAGITQYVEALLSRWDTNGDQHMDLNEANQAYPVFKGPLAQLGGLTGDADWIVKSVFTYVLKNGHPPTKDFLGIASLVGWIAITPFWSIHADRLKLYEVIASIVVPAPLPTATSATFSLRPMLVQADAPPASAASMSYTDLARSFGISLDSGISPLLAPVPMPVASGM